jgi:putative transposase
MLKPSDYKSGHHCKYLLNLHFVWCPKRRKKVLIGDIAKRLREIFLALALEKSWDILALEIAPDHVHLFVGVKPTDASNQVIKRSKGVPRTTYVKNFPNC